VVATAAGI